MPAAASAGEGRACCHSWGHPFASPFRCPHRHSHRRCEMRARGLLSGHGALMVKVPGCLPSRRWRCRCERATHWGGQEGRECLGHLPTRDSGGSAADGGFRVTAGCRGQAGGTLSLSLIGPLLLTGSLIATCEFGCQSGAVRGVWPRDPPKTPCRSLGRPGFLGSPRRFSIGTRRGSFFGRPPRVTRTSEPLGP